MLAPRSTAKSSSSSRTDGIKIDEHHTCGADVGRRRNAGRGASFGGWLLLVTAFGHRKLAGNRGEDALDLIAEPEEDGNGDDGNKGQDQGVLDEGLAFSGSPAKTLAKSPMILRH
jgi:hypothetical protein